MVSNIPNSFDFAQKLGIIQLDNNETFVSFDVVSLYTSVPIDISLDIIKNLIENDTSLNARTPLTSTEILEGLELCLRSTLFVFKNQLYKQVNGVAMGSPVSPIVANLFLADLESHALANFTNTPRIW